MAENSKIQWCDHTFNPWIGCTKVGPGCTHCYAEEMMDKRYGRVQWGKGNPRSLTSDANWKKPLQWNRKAEKEGIRYRVFCSSLADVFDDEVLQEWRDRLWSLIESTPNLDWLLLTKRLNVMSDDELLGMVPGKWMLRSFPDNVWMGHSICTQTEAGRVIPRLIQIPAKVRFLSMEPLLEDVSIKELLDEIQWVIVGGESGKDARLFDADWARSLIEECQQAKVAVFMKQFGSHQLMPCRDENHPDYEKLGPIYRLTGKGDNPDEWPEWARVRQLPEGLEPVESLVQSIGEKV